MRTVKVDIRVEFVDENVPVWWADTPDVNGFYAAADSMEELRAQMRAALAEVVGEDLMVVERLAGPAGNSGAPSVAVARDHRLQLPA